MPVAHNPYAPHGRRRKRDRPAMQEVWRLWRTHAKAARRQQADALQLLSLLADVQQELQGLKQMAAAAVSEQAATLRQHEQELSEARQRLEQLEQAVGSQPSAAARPVDAVPASVPTSADLAYDPFGPGFSLPAAATPPPTPPAPQPSPQPSPQPAAAAAAPQSSSPAYEGWDLLQLGPQPAAEEHSPSRSNSAPAQPAAPAAAAAAAAAAPEQLPSVPASPFPPASPGPAEPQASAAQSPLSSQAAARHSSSWAHLQRRRTAIARQSHRYNSLARREPALREQGGWTAVISAAVGKAADALIRAEELILEAEVAEEAHAQQLAAAAPGAEKTDALKGAEHRAMRSKHACETAYSRLCLAIDTAERHISRAPGGLAAKPSPAAVIAAVTTAQPRAHSFTLDARQRAAVTDARPADGPLGMGARSTWAAPALAPPPVLGRRSTSSVEPTAPAPAPSGTGAGAGPSPLRRPGHRRTVSDTARLPGADGSSSDPAALAALFEALEKRRKALDD